MIAYINIMEELELEDNLYRIDEYFCPNIKLTLNKGRKQCLKTIQII